MDFRAIERVTGVNHNTVINCVRQVGNSLPNTPDYSEIPEFAQVEELQTFAGKKPQGRTLRGDEAMNMIRQNKLLPLEYSSLTIVPASNFCSLFLQHNRLNNPSSAILLRAKWLHRTCSK